MIEIKSIKLYELKTLFSKFVFCEAVMKFIFLIISIHFSTFQYNNQENAVLGSQKAISVALFEVTSMLMTDVGDEMC